MLRCIQYPLLYAMCVMLCGCSPLCWCVGNCTMWAYWETTKRRGLESNLGFKACGCACWAFHLGLDARECFCRPARAAQSVSWLASKRGHDNPSYLSWKWFSTLQTPAVQPLCWNLWATKSTSPHTQAEKHTSSSFTFFLFRWKTWIGKFPDACKVSCKGLVLGVKILSPNLKLT